MLDSLCVSLYWSFCFWHWLRLVTREGAEEVLAAAVVVVFAAVAVDFVAAMAEVFAADTAADTDPAVATGTDSESASEAITDIRGATHMVTRTDMGGTGTIRITDTILIMRIPITGRITTLTYTADIIPTAELTSRSDLTAS